MSFLFFPLLFLAFSLTEYVLSFDAGGGPHSGNVNRFAWLLLARVRGGDAAAAATNRRVTEARFASTKEVSTSVLPLPTSPDKTLQNFFALDSHRNLMFSDDTEVREIGPPSASQLEFMKREQALSSINMTDEEEIKSTLLEVVNPIKFPGMKLYTINTMGSQLFMVPDGTKKERDGGVHVKLPEYRFTLLNTKFRAEGFKPAVWLFYKLTGTKNDDKEDTGKENGEVERPFTSSVTRVWSQVKKDNEVFFKNKARLETRLAIPSVMMRLLPMKLEKFEEQGSNSLQKALDKDLGPAMQRFQNAYLDWISS